MVLWMLLVLLSSGPVCEAQQTAVSSFIAPSALANATNRLVLRQEGLAQFLMEPQVDALVLRGKSGLVIS
jgi:hypothetical protein